MSDGRRDFGLLEFYGDRNDFLVDALGGRVGQFLALLARLLGARRGAGRDRLVLGGAVAGVHVGLNLLVVILDVVDDLVLHRPSEEVQLADGRLDAAVLVVGDGDPVPAAEWIETLFRIGLEFELVVEVDLEARVFIDVVDGVVLLRIIRGEPVYDAERDVRLAVYDVQHLGEFVLVVVVADEVLKEEDVLGYHWLGHLCLVLMWNGALERMEAIF